MREKEKQQKTANKRDPQSTSTSNKWHLLQKAAPL